MKVFTNIEMDTMYKGLMAYVNQRLTETLKDGAPLYRISLSEKLSRTYLRVIGELVGDEEIVQHYNCNACKWFLDEYAGLVKFDDGDNVVPIIWENIVTDNELIDRISKQFYGNSMQIVTAFRSRRYGWNKVLSGGFEHIEFVYPEIAKAYHSTNRSADVKAINQKKGYLARVFNGINFKSYEYMDRLVRDEVLELTELHKKFWEFTINAVRTYFDYLNEAKIKANNYLWWLTQASMPITKLKQHVLYFILERIDRAFNENGKPDVNKLVRAYKEMTHGSNYMQTTVKASADQISDLIEMIKEYGYEKSFDYQVATMNDVVDYMVWISPLSEDDKTEEESGIISELNKVLQKKKRAEEHAFVIDESNEMITMDMCKNISVAQLFDIIKDAKSIQIKCERVEPCFGVIRPVNLEAPLLTSVDCPAIPYAVSMRNPHGELVNACLINVFNIPIGWVDVIAVILTSQHLSGSQAGLLIDNAGLDNISEKYFLDYSILKPEICKHRRAINEFVENKVIEPVPDTEKHISTVGGIGLRDGLEFRITNKNNVIKNYKLVRLDHDFTDDMVKTLSAIEVERWIKKMYPAP